MSEFDWTLYRQIERHLKNNRHERYRQQHDAQRKDLLDEIIDTLELLSKPTAGVRENLESSTDQQLKNLLRELTELRTRTVYQRIEKDYERIEAGNGKGK